MIQSSPAVSFKLSVSFRTLGFLNSRDVVELKVTLLNCSEVNGRLDETNIVHCGVRDFSYCGYFRQN